MTRLILFRAITFGVPSRLAILISSNLTVLREEAFCARARNPAVRDIGRK